MAAQHQQQHRPATGTATVSVACKIPTGFRLRLNRAITEVEQTVRGTMETTRHVFDGREVIVNGPAHLQTEGPRCLIINGAAITGGVPKDFWDAWYEQHKELDLVRNGFIYAHEKRDGITGMSEDRKAERTGLERLNPHKLPDMRRNFSRRGQDGRELSKVETAAEQPAEIGQLDDDRNGDR